MTIVQLGKQGGPLFLLFLFFCGVALRDSFGSDTVKTVALTGMQEHQTGGVFTNLYLPSALNNNGQTAFRGDLSGAGVDSSNNAGIWIGGASTNLDLVARKGEEAPGTSARFNDIGLPSLNNAGHVTFSSSLTGGDADNTNSAGLWSQGGGMGLALVARRGDAAPGTSDFFRTVGELQPNDNGQTVIIASLIDSPFQEGIWRKDAVGNLALVSREGGDAPGTSTTFETFGGFSVNHNGQIAIVSGLFPSGSSEDGIWREGDNGLELLARKGDPAPGTSVNFDSFAGYLPKLDSNGQAAFVGYLTGAGVNGTNHAGIWSERGDNGLKLVLRSGSGNAPGTSARFREFGQLVQNSEGQLAFFADLAVASPTNNQGIWSERPGAGLSLIAREGSVAPGSEFAFYSFGSLSLAFNNNGLAAFLGVVSDPNMLPRSPQFTGIWAQDVQGNLQLVALQGEMLDVSDDPSQPDLRTIASLNFRQGGFNDLGQLTFYATFTDGSSGIFVSNLVSVPEPQSIAFVASATLGAVLCLRSRSNLRTVA